MKHTITRVISMLLVLTICLSCLPTEAFAWGKMTHVYTANLMEDEAFDGSVTLRYNVNSEDEVRNFQYDIPQEFLDAIQSYPDAFRAGAQLLQNMPDNGRILIAEACSHIPKNEDIGRVKLPRLLRKKFGENLKIDIVGGNDFPEDLTPYNLIIHCGACMFNRRAVMSRVRQAKVQGVPITNYGVAIAALNGILDRVCM